MGDVAKIVISERKFGLLCQNSILTNHHTATEGDKSIGEIFILHIPIKPDIYFADLGKAMGCYAKTFVVH